MAIVSMLYGAGGASSAEDVSYDNTTSGLEADNVQDAIDEINSNLEVMNGWNEYTYNHPNTSGTDVDHIIQNDGMLMLNASFKSPTLKTGKYQKLITIYDSTKATMKAQYNEEVYLTYVDGVFNRVRLCASIFCPVKSGDIVVLGCADTTSTTVSCNIALN